MTPRGGGEPDDAGAGAGCASLGGDEGVMSLEGDETGREDGAADFLGAAAEPPEKNEAIDLCMCR